MFVVYATGKYITGLNENGGLCETVTYQQTCESPNGLALHVTMLCAAAAFVAPFSETACILFAGLHHHTVRVLWLLSTPSCIAA